ncbi:MAG: type II toxin-antitoxin system HicA family toxin [Bacteroidota bacterium]
MVYDRHRLAIPSNQEYSVPQLRMMLREVETLLGRRVQAAEWNSLA